MLNAKAKNYGYAILGSRNSYGEKTIPTTATGTIYMALSIMTKSVADNPLYTDVEYVGLTHNLNANSSYVVFNGTEKLKVKYNTLHGDYNVLYLQRIK